MGTNVQKNHPPFNSAQKVFCSNILPCRYDFMVFSAILGEDPHSRLLHMTTTPLSTPLFYTIEKIVISAFFLVITILSENAFVLLCRPTKNKQIRSCSMSCQIDSSVRWIFNKNEKILNLRIMGTTVDQLQNIISISLY